jgi:F-type H+-transporting ATPase subunit delta
MRDQVAARRYARALFEACGDVMKRKSAQRDLLGLSELMGTAPSLGATLESPIVPAAKRTELLKSVGAKLNVQATTRRFLEVLVEAKRVGNLPEIAAEFSAMVSAAEGRQQVDVVTASPLTMPQKTKLKTLIEKKLGARVELRTQTDPSLVAGVTLRVGDKEIDASLRARLEGLRRSLEQG